MQIHTYADTHAGMACMHTVYEHITQAMNEIIFVRFHLIFFFFCVFNFFSLFFGEYEKGNEILKKLKTCWFLRNLALKQLGNIKSSSKTKTNSIKLD